MSEERWNTASKGELTKVNVEGCRGCGQVYVSKLNAGKLNIEPGWYPLGDIQQQSPGDQGLDVVIRVRGRVWGGVQGKRVCPTCKDKDF